MHGPFRITPKLPAHALKTYELRAPLVTHHRAATCEEVDCQAYAKGWTSYIDVGTELGAKQYKYISEQSGRTFNDATAMDTQIRTLIFPPGQKCFRQHTVPLERDPLYIVRDGDWRGNPRRTTEVRRNAADWIDDFSNHQDGIATEIEKG
jgi:hypothetical protein